MEQPLEEGGRLPTNLRHMISEIPKITCSKTVIDTDHDAFDVRSWIVQESKEIHRRTGMHWWSS